MRGVQRTLQRRALYFLYEPSAGIGSPGRIQILDHLLWEITSKEDVWVATGTEIADWYRNHSKEEEDKG